MKKLKCKTCGKEYLIDEEELIMVNGVYGIYCKDSCGAFVDVKEMAQGKEKHVDLRCEVCATPLDLSKRDNNILKCPHCSHVMTLPNKSQTNDIIDIINQGKLQLSICNFDEAYEMFTKVIECDAYEAEGYFYRALSRYKIQYLVDLPDIDDETRIKYPKLQPISYSYKIQDTKFTEDRDYKKAIELSSELQKKEYIRRGEEIDNIINEFSRLEKEGIDYDCFICTKVSEINDKNKKTEDYHIACEIYHNLREKGYHPFFSEISLSNAEVVGTKYEAHILYALYKSKCMLLVCSNEEYLDTKWVKNEYRRYQSFIEAKEKKDSSIAIIYKDKIIETIPGIKEGIQGIPYPKLNTIELIDGFIGKFISGDNVNEDIVLKRVEIQHNKKEKLINRQNASQFLNTNNKEINRDMDYNGVHHKNKKKHKIKASTKIVASLIFLITIIISVPIFLAFNTSKNTHTLRIEEGIQAISSYKYQNNEIITKVYIPSSVKSIGEGAFNGCVNLKTIEFIGESELIEIKSNAFNDCKQLRNIELPNSINRIEADAFSGCNSLQYKEFGNALYLGNSSNQYLTVIKSIDKEIIFANIYDGTKVISERAFFGCNNLKQVLIPDSVESIGSEAFRQTQIVTANVSSNIKILERGVFFECKNLEQLGIAGKIEVIPNSLCYGCEKLENITISNSITSIEDLAFFDCKQLKTLNIPDGIKTIGHSAFEGCISLKEIIVPNSVVSLGKGAFAKCSSLEYIALPILGSGDGSITHFGYIFGSGNYYSNDDYVPKSLKLVVLTSNVTSINEHDFYGCSFILFLPSSVIDISDKAFRDSYVTIYSESVAAINDWNSDIDNDVFFGIKKIIVREDGFVIAVKDDFASVISYIEYDKKSNLYIPKTISWDSQSYEVTNISNNSFSGLTSVVSIEIPNSLTSIGNFAFYDCESLTSIVIPSSVTSIGDRAFAFCRSLTIYCEADSQPSGWSSTWNPDSRAVYWLGQWSYVNGIPKPNEE